MPVLVNSKWEIFTQEWALGKGKTDSALIAGYSKIRAAQTASRLVKNGKILARYEELKQQAASAKVASYQERQEILSEIARGKLSDFIECGQDGAWINIDREKMNAAALQAIDTKTEYDDDGAHPTVVTKIRLHSPTQAIDLLNKMDKIYSEAPQNIYNEIKIVVIREPFKPKELNGNGNERNQGNNP